MAVSTQELRSRWCCRNPHTPWTRWIYPPILLTGSKLSYILDYRYVFLATCCSRWGIPETSTATFNAAPVWNIGHEASWPAWRIILSSTIGVVSLSTNAVDGFVDDIDDLVLILVLEICLIEPPGRTCTSLCGVVSGCGCCCCWMWWEGPQSPSQFPAPDSLPNVQLQSLRHYPRLEQGPGKFPTTMYESRPPGSPTCILLVGWEGGVEADVVDIWAFQRYRVPCILETGRGAITSQTDTHTREMWWR